MKIKSLPIRDYVWPDIPLKPHQTADFLSHEILGFIGRHKSLFDNADELIRRMHNSGHHYTVVQIGSDKGALNITAYGKDAIRDVENWWKIYKKVNNIRPDNQIICKEKYTLSYDARPHTYRADTLLINRRKARELEALENNPSAYYETFERYLTANFLPLYNLIGHRHDKEKHDVTPRILQIKKHPRTYKVFRQYRRPGFDVVFQTVLRLPVHFRMGESTALGYGKITHL